MESWPFAPWISALIARSPSAHAKKHLEYLISKTNANNMIYLIAETRLRMIMGRQRWRATEWQTTNKVVSEWGGVRNSTILHFYKSISPQVYILQSCSSTSCKSTWPLFYILQLQYLCQSLRCRLVPSPWCQHLQIHKRCRDSSSRPKWANTEIQEGDNAAAKRIGYLHTRVPLPTRPYFLYLLLLLRLRGLR